MRYCVFTVNVGDFAPRSTLESLAAAAKRWGADYCELNTRFSPKYHPSYTKVHAAAMLFSNYDMVAYFDGDTVIHYEAPNVFEECLDTDRFYAVRQERPTDPEFYSVHEHAESDAQFDESIMRRPLEAVQLNCRCRYRGDLNNFFNGGMFVCSPENRALTKFLVSLPDLPAEAKEDTLVEQALLNTVVDCSDNLTLLDPTWNYTGRPVKGYMRAYVYHFTGTGPSRAQLVDYWKNCPWRGPFDTVNDVRKRAS